MSTHPVALSWWVRGRYLAHARRTPQAPPPQPVCVCQGGLQEDPLTKGVWGYQGGQVCPSWTCTALWGTEGWADCSPYGYPSY